MTHDRSVRRVLRTLGTLGAAIATGMLALAGATHAVSSGLVVSQVYGGGGNTGATYRNDFIEIFNRGTTAVDVTGWSVQYAASAGSSWSVTPLAGSIPAGGYYLVQEAQGAGGTTDLPAPDATGSIAMSATSGKVALVSSTVALSGTCPAGATLVDLVGYGGASCFEGAPMPALTNTTAGLRNTAGCGETDDNSLDFATGAPTPRSSASAPNPCAFLLDVTASPLAGGSVSRSPDLPAYAPGSLVDLTATAAPGWHFVAWSGDASGSTNPLTVTMDADKSVTATFALDTYTLTVATAGSGTVAKAPDQPSYDPGAEVVLTATPAAGWHFVGWSGDASGDANPLGVTMDADKSVTATFELNARAGALVLSQVYGGGGNSGATFQNDYIEIYNRGDLTVDLTGLSVQYGPATGTTWSATPLAGSLAPGRYYLVQEAQGSGGTTALPTPDATGEIAMNAAAGKVALVDGIAELGDACPAGPAILDLVGYGAANCSETFASGGLGNTTAAFRKSGGCEDTGDNSADIVTGAPAPRNSASPVHSCVYSVTLSVDPPGTGSASKSPDQARYAHGTTLVLTAAPMSGYHFAGWTGGASGSANPLTLVLGADAAVTAHFEANALSGDMVISQVYGGGGNTGATYKNDYIELYNRGNATVNVTGWTVQYASSGGGPWFTTTLVGSVVPGGYYLVQQDHGTGGTADLPVPDAIGTINISSVDGKLALVSGLEVLTGACPSSASIVDMVGYGTVNCAEGTAATGPDNLTALHRNDGGCDESNDNVADFSVGPPTPRNTGSPVHVCSLWLGADRPGITDVSLAPVTPNPARGPVRVRFTLPREGKVRLGVFDLQGRLVERLVDGAMGPGVHEVPWRAGNRSTASGASVFFVRLEVEGRRFVRSAVIME